MCQRHAQKDHRNGESTWKHSTAMCSISVYLRHSLFAAYRVWSLSRFTADPGIPSLAFVYSRRQDLKKRPSGDGEKCTFYLSTNMILFLLFSSIQWLLSIGFKLIIPRLKEPKALPKFDARDCWWLGGSVCNPEVTVIGRHIPNLGFLTRCRSKWRLEVYFLRFAFMSHHSILQVAMDSSDLFCTKLSSTGPNWRLWDDSRWAEELQQSGRSSTPCCRIWWVITEWIQCMDRHCTCSTCGGEQDPNHSKIYTELQDERGI